MEHKIVIIDGDAVGPGLDALLEEVGEPTVTVTISGVKGAGKTMLANMWANSTRKNLFNVPARLKSEMRVKIVVTDA